MSNQLAQINISAVKKRMAESGMNPEAIARETSFALQLWNNNAQLQKCNPNSIMAAIVNVANVGLTLNPAAQEAALIARGGVCILDPMYRGMLRLAKEAGAIRASVAHLVYEGDNFRIDLADTQKPVTHGKCLISSKKGNIMGAYCLLTLPGGDKQPEWMDIEELYRVRETSKSWKAFKSGSISNTPWDGSFGEMARKTVLKRALKYAPRGTNAAQTALDRALELSNQDYPASINQTMAIETLLRTANITPEQADQIQGELNAGLSQDEAAVIINQLNDAQINDPRYTGAESVTQTKKGIEDAAKDEKR